MRIDGHFHWDCPLCSEEAIPERCPAYKHEWAVNVPLLDDILEQLPMVRLWFKDGTYTDVNANLVEYYECDPELDHIERLDGQDEEEGHLYRYQNGQMVRVQ